MNRHNIYSMPIGPCSNVMQHVAVCLEVEATLPNIHIKKTSLLLSSKNPQTSESPKRKIDITQNNSSKWTVNSSSTRLKSLGEHRRSYSTLVRNVKASRNVQDKAKLERIRQGCVPGVSLREDSDTMAESEIQESQDQFIGSRMTTYAPAKNKWLVKPIYAGRSPTIYFPYCPETKLNDSPRPPRVYELSEKQLQHCRLYYKFPADRPFKCVVTPLHHAGFEETEQSDWTVFWGMPRRNIVKKMSKNQRVNHFPGCWELGRKDNLWRNLWSVKKRFKQQYSFVPNTYILPDDLQRFERSKEQADKKRLWIMKPVASACGRGVKMLSKKSKVHRRRNYLVMEYIANPLLINGLKFDLRIYVLVSSYDPLRIYLFEEGLTRFATQKYTTDPSELTKKYIHLTNYAVNKHAPKFTANKNADVDGEGSKWSLTALKKYLRQHNYDVDTLFKNIEDVIIKTCIATEPNMLDIFCKTAEHRNNCFELYGFDVLIDSTLKPWLLEVNVCPSLSSTSPLDTKIKHTLLTDTFNLIGIQPPLKPQSSAVSMPKEIFSRNIRHLTDLNATNCVQRLGVQDWNVLFETEEQNYRRGHFKRIFPNRDNVQHYQQFFEFQRYNNIMVMRWLMSNENFLDQVSKRQCQQTI